MTENDEKFRQEFEKIDEEMQMQELDDIEADQDEEENEAQEEEKKEVSPEEELKRLKEDFELEQKYGVIRKIPKQTESGTLNGIELYGKVLKRRTIELYDLEAKKRERKIRKKEETKKNGGSAEANTEDLDKKIEQKKTEYREILKTFRGYFDSLITNGYFDDVPVQKEKGKTTEWEIETCLNHYSKQPILEIYQEKKQILDKIKQHRESKKGEEAYGV